MNDVEAWSHGNGVAPRAVFDYAAMNQRLPGDAPTALAVQQSVITTFAVYKVPAQAAPLQGPQYSTGTPIGLGSNLPPGTVVQQTVTQIQNAPGYYAGTPTGLDSTVTIEVLYAYVMSYGAFPSSPSDLITWATGRGYLNSLGRQVTTPSVDTGADYVGLGSSSSTTSSTGGSSASGLNLGVFDFASFLNQLTSNPMGAVQSYPGAAVIVGFGAYKLAHMFKLIR